MSDNDSSVTSVIFESRRNRHPVEAMKLSHKVSVAARQLWATTPACSAQKRSSMENGPVCLYYVIAKAFGFFKFVLISVKVNQMS